MKLKELIIQQYSSYDKSTGKCNLHLDGNLNATLHAIVIDVKAAKKRITDHITLNFVITRPIMVEGLDIMEGLFEDLYHELSDDKVTVTIDFLETLEYGKSADENRQKCHDILGGLFVFGEKEFIEQFDAIETHFEKTLTNKLITNEILKWKSGKMSIGVDRILNTRLNISKHSIDDTRDFLWGYEGGIASLVAVCNTVVVQNQQQIDYIKTYCNGIDPNKFRVGIKTNNKKITSFLFSESLFEIQMNWFRIRRSTFLTNFIHFFQENNIKYFFPFRLSDPDWGFDQITEEDKKFTIVTNPTNVDFEKSDIQKEFESIIEGYGADAREILFTIYRLLKYKHIDVKIPLYSDIFNIVHQTTAELLYFCPSNVEYRFDTGDNYIDRVNKLTYETNENILV